VPVVSILVVTVTGFSSVIVAVAMVSPFAVFITVMDPLVTGIPVSLSVTNTSSVVFPRVLLVIVAVVVDCLGFTIIVYVLVVLL